MRPSTPPRPNGRGGKTIRVHRNCNGCGSDIGDATLAEIDTAITGEPISDVTGECPLCTLRAALKSDDANPWGDWPLDREAVAWLLAQIDEARAEVTS